MEVRHIFRSNQSGPSPDFDDAAVFGSAQNDLAARGGAPTLGGDGVGVHGDGRNRVHGLAVDGGDDGRAVREELIGQGNDAVGHVVDTARRSARGGRQFAGAQGHAQLGGARAHTGGVAGAGERRGGDEGDVADLGDGREDRVDAVGDRRGRGGVAGGGAARARGRGRERRAARSGRAGREVLQRGRDGRQRARHGSRAPGGRVVGKARHAARGWWWWLRTVWLRTVSGRGGTRSTGVPG